MSWCAAAAFLLWAGAAGALAPDELLLLVNENSPRSLALANRYVQLRRLPPENVVYLPLPESVLAPAAECSPAEFTRWIWEPAQAQLRARGLENRILAWVFSADFPLRITSTPPLSLTGLTFLRNQLPEPRLVVAGSYVSPFFAGPDRPDGPLADSHSLRWFRDTTYDALPLPAMLLAYTGARGLELPAALHQLEQAAAPLPPEQKKNGVIWLVVSDDVRSKMRAWQFSQARAELADSAVTAVITNALPAAGAPAALGLMAGTAWITPPDLVYRPGCYADHCTSFGALFHTADQTKLTAWLQAGAALSSGTVAEPYAIWTKFPGARFFAHYAHGCSALESLAQSVRCPLQLLPVGDPLAAPWAPSLAVSLTAQADEQRVTLRLRADGVEPQNVNIQFFLDGRPLGAESHSPTAVIDTAPLADGYHRVRAVATTGFLILTTAAAENGFLLNRRDRAVTLAGAPADGRVNLFRPLPLQIAAAGAPRDVGLFCGDRLLLRGRSRAVTLDPAVLGAGPVTLQAAAFYADGTVVRSAPLSLEILPANRPPVIRALTRRAGRRQAVEVQPDVLDPDGDSVALRWCRQLPLTITEAASVTSGVVRATPGGAAFSTTNTAAVWLFPQRRPAKLQEVSVTLHPAPDSLTVNAQAGLVFNGREGTSEFFGLVGETSGWTLGSVRAGTLTPTAARGAPVRPGTAYRLSVREGDGGVLECRVNDELVLRKEQGTLGAGEIGLRVCGPGAVFSDLRISPPDRSDVMEPQDDGRLVLRQPEAAAAAGLLLEADDGHAVTSQAWPSKP